MQKDAAARRLSTISNHVSPSQSHSVWDGVEMAPPDPILGVTEAWKKDSDPNKMNLGVGAYRTEEGKPLVLEVVREVERRIVADSSRDKEYAPIGGSPEFCRAAVRLALGPDSQALGEGRVTTLQSLSGTGALRAGAELLTRHYPVKVVYLPNPTWGNHRNIFGSARMEVRQYRYFDPQTRGLDYTGLLADLDAATPGAVVLLHACAHNPTGVDPTPEQWRGILAVVQRRRLLPFFDSAYQGFASGDLDADAASLRLFESSGCELLLAQSFAKNMGLYGERVGALSVVCASTAAAALVESQVKVAARALWSNPPRHGAAIATMVLTDPQLMERWKEELRGMASRISAMRSALMSELSAAGAPGDWGHIGRQIGMFSFTGLTRAQCERLRDKWHVYMTLDGRVSLAGLSRSRCGYLARAMADAVQNA